MAIEAKNLPFTSADFSIKKSFEFDGIVYKLRLRKNNQTDGYSMDIFDTFDNHLFTGRVAYKTSVIDAPYPDLPFQILPLDINELINQLEAETEITDDNLGDTVKLYTEIDII